MTTLEDEVPTSDRQRRQRREHLANYANRILVQGSSLASLACFTGFLGSHNVGASSSLGKGRVQRFLREPRRSVVACALCRGFMSP